MSNPNPAVCQVADMSLVDYLPCPFTESGGRKCEELKPHTDEHWFSEHTIIHDRLGNGHHCLSFEEPVASGAYRTRLVEKIANLTKELEELDRSSTLM